MIRSAAFSMKEQLERSLGVVPQAQDIVKRFLLDHAPMLIRRSPTCRFEYASERLPGRNQDYTNAYILSAI